MYPNPQSEFPGIEKNAQGYCAYGYCDNIIEYTIDVDYNIFTNRHVDRIGERGLCEDHYWDGIRLGAINA